MGGGSSKKVTVGYKYYLGMHMILCHGPIDKLVRILVDKRVAWSGGSTGGRVSVQAAKLFGGEKREGGVSGEVDLEMGLPTQGQNDYLQSQLGSDIPAFRGVVGVVLRQCYLGLNPYLKKWAFRAQRIHTRQNGVAQWYDAKAETPGSTYLGAQQEFTSFSSGWSTNNPTKFQIIDGMIANTLVNANNADYYRVPAPAFTITGLYCEFKLINRDLGDPLGIRFDTAGGGQLFSFMPQAEDAFDPGRRRPHVNYWTTPIPIYESELAQGVLYSFEAQMDNDAGTYTYFLRQGSTLLATGTAPLPAGTPAYVTFGRSSNDMPSRTGIAGYNKLVVSGYAKSGDMNPAHIIRECLTDPEWGMGYQETDIDDSSFTSAADKLYEEGFGISILWDRQTPIEDFVKEIVRHINAVLYVDRTTGKFSLKLIRGDYSEGSLPVLGPDQIDKVDNFSRPAFGELINSVTVNYWDSLTGTAASTTAHDTALVQMQGAVIGTTIQYPGCTNAALAGRLASRDLRTLSNPLLSCTIYADRTASLLNIGDVFKLDWPDLLAAPVVMRVVGLAFGDGKTNKVKVTCAEDIFSLPQVGAVAPQPPVWEDPSIVPTPADVRVVIEAPYYELVQRMGQTSADELLNSSPETGYLLASARRPPGAINASLMVDAGAGYEDNGVVEFCPAAELSAPVGQLDTTLPITNADALDEIRIGSLLQLGEELVRVDSVGETSITVGRGVLDTVPAKHMAGTPLLAWDDYAEGDQVEYLDGETVGVQLLPVSGAGQLLLAEAPEDSLTFTSRAFRPYPPGNLKIGGVAYPATIGGSAGLALTWSHRDRVQQTAGDIVDTTAGNIGPEAGTAYNLRIYGEDGSTLLRELLGLTDTSYDYTTALEYDDMGVAAAAAGKTYGDLVTAAAPTHWWRLNEPSGTTFTSVVGSWVADTSGTHTRGVTGLLAGDDDKAVQWGSSSSYAQTGFDTAHRLGTSDFTLSCMVKYTWAGFSCVLGVRSGNSPSLILALITTGRITAGDISAETWAWTDVNTRVRHPGVNDGNPHHVTVVYKHSTTTLELWVDGVLRDSRSQGAGRPDTGTLNIVLGNNTNLAQGFVGTQDEVLMFNRALSPAEIEELAAVALTGPVPEEGRLNGKLRVVLESERDGYTSHQAHDYTVVRTGYGFD